MTSSGTPIAVSYTHLDVYKRQALNLGVSFVLAFVAAMVVWALLAKLIRMLIHATPLSLPDRLLGAAFGLLRGVVLLMAVATAVSLTPAAQSPAWRASVGARMLGGMLQGLSLIHI